MVAAIDPGALSAADAKALVELFGEVERLAVAGRTLAVKRVTESSLWRAQGDRSPERWLARATGSTLGDAAGVVATAKSIERMPATEAALRAGRLSAPQAREITEATAVAPDAEASLLRTCAREGLMGLRTEARRVRIAATDSTGRAEAIRQARYLVHSSDAEGAFRLELRGPMSDGLALVSALRPYQEAAYATARRAGRHEPAAAHAFDALITLATTTTAAGAADTAPSADTEATEDAGAGPARRRPKGSAAKVIVRIDHTALTRGHAEPGETCDIAGIGPIAVSTVRDIITNDDPFLTAIITKGTDVTTVTHLGRQPTAHQRTALEWRDPMCTNIACTNTLALEIDHRTQWATTHHTRTDDLDRLCPTCHRQKTHHGWHLDPGTGRRPLRPPNTNHPHQPTLTT
ncbi:MAG: protein of unknown function endonuclease [Acidimicrobiales bacterium]|nr:protein of unknown function endonuclease [Acidimicrobiales bacterium]